MKKSILITILIMASASMATCQDLLIRYDMVNREIEYYKITKHKGTEKLVKMKNPRVGPNRNVRVEYVNLNPFIYNQPKVNLVSVAQDSVSSFNPFTMMLPSSVNDRFGSMGFSFTRDAAALSPQQKMCALALRSLYDAYDQINYLKYNFKLTKQQIIDQSNDKIRSVEKTCNLPVQADTSAEVFARSDFEALKWYFKDMCQIDIPGLTRSASDSKTDSFLGSAGIDANSKLLPPTDALNSIEKNYLSVTNADFTSENSFILSDKDAVMHMDFMLTDEYMKKTEKDTTHSKDAKSKKVRSQSIFIPVSGGVRVSSSAGIGFTYLGEARKYYYINDDSTLTAAPDYRITPVVGTFLNVYSRGMGAVNLGGSFGIFASLEETLSINYLLGFTAAFGRKERVLLSAGCVMAPVQEPSKGYYVGMHTTNMDFPTKLNYKPGLFFCVHYNVGKF
jgi:hypothetical protein